MAGQGVTIGGDELNEALRRAVVVRAVSGDPHRELSLDEEAVIRLAEELDSAERREQLQQALAAFGDAAGRRPAVAEAIVTLVSEPDLAWRAFCAALLADVLARES